MTGGGISKLDIADQTEEQEVTEIFTSPSTETDVPAEEETAEIFSDGLGEEEGEMIFSTAEPIPVMRNGSISIKDIDWNDTSQIDWTQVDWTGVDWSLVQKDKVDWGKINWSTVKWGTANPPDYVLSFLDVDKVDWTEVDWSQIDWSKFGNWDTTQEYGIPWTNEDIFWRAVDWSDVNWKGMNWKYLDIKKVQMGNSNQGWAHVDWSKVDWNVVEWTKLMELKNNNYINYTVDFPGLDAQNGTITTVFVKNYQFYTIPSEQVTISVTNPAVQGASYTVPTSAYIVYVDDNKRHLQSVGNLKATPNDGCVDIFSDLDKKITLIESLPPALDDSSYWDVKVDESKCNFAVPPTDRKPIVTIQSIDKQVKLEEGVDFRVELEGDPPSACKDYKLKIYPVKTSNKISGIESSAGYITRNYTMHFSNVADYYNLKGIEKEIKYGASVPRLSETFEKISENVYLEQKNTAIGDLPKTTDSDNEALWSESPYLKIEYRYDTENWISVFKWDDWKDKHTSDLVEVRVSVASTDSEYYDGTLTKRYLQGSIYSSFKVSPYSLTETSPGKMPPTKVLNNGWYYFAFVNPTETIDPNKEPGYPDRYIKVEEGTIQPVVYTGKEQTPQFDLVMYAYCTGWTPNFGDPGPFFYGRQTLPNRTYIWSNNVNAGKTASVEIKFISDKGDFTGSITRSFEILPKDIADTKTINVEAVDFVYDGKEHQPKLIIYDSEAGDILQEGKDYTVTTVPDKPTNPGTINVEITGIGNYTGTTSASYNIINTSSGSGTIVIPTIGDGSRYDISVGTATYNGKAQLPEITVTNIASGAKLKEGTDYKVEAATGADNTNAGLGKVKITGITVSGSIDRSFMIKSKPLDDTIQTEASDVTYNGKAQLPQVTVTDTALKASLVQEKDFILYAGSGADNINVGIGTAVIRGMGNYTGTKDISFKIAEAYKDEDGNTHYADGSIQAPDGSYLKPGKVMISLVKAQGNRVSIYLSGEARGARGYDYVIGTSADMLKTKKYYRVNKNQMNIYTNMYYVGKGTYYAACHAWARGADGKKKFGPWSELKQFNVTAITPQTPEIISTEVNGSTVTITYSKCRNAAGYDVVLGTARKKENGEMRPVNYGTLVKKNINKDTLTVTFKNVPKGVYFAGLHAYNLTGPGKTKVFSWWSDTKRIKV